MECILVVGIFGYVPVALLLGKLLVVYLLYDEFTVHPVLSFKMMTIMESWWDITSYFGASWTDVYFSPFHISYPNGVLSALRKALVEEQEVV